MWHNRGRDVYEQNQVLDRKSSGAISHVFYKGQRVGNESWNIYYRRGIKISLVNPPNVIESSRYPNKSRTRLALIDFGFLGDDQESASRIKDRLAYISELRGIKYYTR